MIYKCIFLVSVVQYLLLVQHVELISRAHAEAGVPVVVVLTVVWRAVVDGTLVRGAVVGGTVEGGAVVDGTVEGGTVVGGTFGSVGGSVEGVGVGAVMVVMMIGGGDSTPCIWTGEKERGEVGEDGRRGERGGLGSLVAGLRCRDTCLSS